MHRLISRPRIAFTLIEILITVSLFTMIMTVLLAGLHAGGQAWSRADKGLVRSVAVRTAIEEFVWDLEHALFEMESEEPILRGELDESKRPVVQLKSVASRDRDQPAGGVNTIVWELREDLGGQLNWVRARQPAVGDRAMEVTQEHVMLEDVGNLKIEYFTGDQWQDSWSDGRKLPQLARIHVELAGTPRTLDVAVASIYGGSLE